VTVIQHDELTSMIGEIEDYARGYGLDFFPVIFEMLDYEGINMVASYGGFPTRYPHWRFGMQYEYMQKSYGYGLHKIYEMVINNNPCYAYLLNSNQMVDQKLVIAHVYAHCDFFKNNAYFKNTNRRMMDEMANHGNRIADYMSKYGRDVVENFLDVCSSIENLIDPNALFETVERRVEPVSDEVAPARDVGRLKSKSTWTLSIRPSISAPAPGAGRERARRSSRRGRSGHAPVLDRHARCPIGNVTFSRFARRRTTSPPRRRPRS
jgi:stage V sporulation protein R